MTTAKTNERFWVVGGDYECTGFHQLKGAPEMRGPFDNRQAATRAWRDLSEQNRSRATARYAIAAEQISLPQ